MKYWLLAWVVAQGLDTATTLHHLNNPRAQDVNPIIGSSKARLIGVKVGGNALGILIHRKSKNKWVTPLIFTVHGGLGATWNLSR